MFIKLYMNYHLWCASVLTSGLKNAGSDVFYYLYDKRLRRFNANVYECKVLLISRERIKMRKLYIKKLNYTLLIPCRCQDSV